MRYRPSFVALAAAAALCAGLCPRAARAESERERQAAALFREGRAALEKGDQAAACAKFAESIRFAESAGPIVNLAQCEERRGDLVAALALWKKGLALLPAGDERVAPAQKRIDDLMRRVPTLVIKLDASTPEGARITVDDVEIPRATAGAPRPLNPGEHRVAVEASGRAAWRTTVTLAEGRQSQVVALLPAPGEKAPEEGGGSSLRTAGFVVGGVGAASLIVGAVTGGLTIAKKNAVDENCVGGCNEAARDAARAGKTLGAVSTATFIAGAAGVGAGVLMIVLGKPKAPAAVAPVAFPGGAGLSVWRRF